MVFLEANRVASSIEVTNSVAPVLAGTAIDGRVVLQVTQPLTARCAVLSYKVRYFAIADVPGQRADRLETVAIHRINAINETAQTEPKKMYDKVLHSASYVLFGRRDGSNATPVEPGTYLYPFTIRVPVHVPPTITGSILGERHCCCLGCECRCAMRSSWAGVAHYLKVTVFIANSLKDNVTRRSVRVVRAVRPQAVFCSVPRMVQFTAEAHACASCIPSLATLLVQLTNCFKSNHTASVQLTVIRPVLVADDAILQSVEFEVTGIFTSPLTVCLYREAFVEGGDRGRRLIASQVVEARQGQPTRQVLRVPSARSLQISSCSWVQSSVEYYVTVEMHVQSGCCTALLPGHVPKIPVYVFDTLSENAPSYADVPDTPVLPPAPNFGAPAMGHPTEPYAATAQPPAAVGAMPPLYSPQQSSAYVVPGIDITYAYVAPHGSEAHVVGAVTERLPEAVWGTVVPPPLGPAAM